MPDASKVKGIMHIEAHNLKEENAYRGCLLCSYRLETIYPCQAEKQIRQRRSYVLQLV